MFPPSLKNLHKLFVTISFSSYCPWGVLGRDWIVWDKCTSYSKMISLRRFYLWHLITQLFNHEILTVGFVVCENLTYGILFIWYKVFNSVYSCGFLDSILSWGLFITYSCIHIPLEFLHDFTISNILNGTYLYNVMWPYNWKHLKFHVIWVINDKFWETK